MEFDVSGHSKLALTFLAPNMFNCYQSIVTYISRTLGIEMELRQGESYEEAYDADLSFICGLPYVLRTAPRHNPPAFTAIAAPVLKGDRYQGKPVYYSDVIVHRDSPYFSLADLRGRTWAYNEPESQSGYGITRYHLATLGETGGFFSKVIGTGFHQKSLRMVASKRVDASAIDSQVMSVEMRDHPQLAEKLRIVGSLGPSTIQPIVVREDMPPALKAEIQSVVKEMHKDPAVRQHLDYGEIDRFIAIDDDAYDDIREMLVTCEDAGFLELQ